MREDWHGTGDERVLAGAIGVHREHFPVPAAA